MASISEEEENYIRLTLLLKGVSPRAVRTYFDKEFPPTHLPSTLNTIYDSLSVLKLRRRLNQAQWNLLFPRNGLPDSKTFDVTLMICLIRHMTHINQPINGFDTLPLHMEKTPGADLARIKWYRNVLAHQDSSRMATVDFNTAWSNISDALSRLGGRAIYQECQELKVKVLDKSNQEVMLEIKQSLKEIKELKQTMDSSGTENLKNLEENLRKLRSTLQTENPEGTERLEYNIQPNVGETASSTSSAVPISLRTNYARIGHALQQLFPDILRELIAIKEPPQKLSHDVNTDRYLSKHLRADEFSFIDHVEAIGYAYFDIPLIYKLVRMLKLVPSPTQGWNNSTAPCPTEVTPGDDLERIRILRNEILHRGNSQITYTELSQYFTQFMNIAGRLETYLGKQTGEYVNKFIRLETCDIDEETTNLFCKRLERLLNSIDDIDDIDDDAERFHAIEKDSDALKERKDSIGTRAFQANSTIVRDDVEINGYKGMNNKGKYGFYLFDIVCDNFVVDCIIDRRLKRKCRKSVTEFQECTDEIKQWRRAQTSVNEKVNEKFLHFVKWRKSFLCQYFLNHTSFNEIENGILVHALCFSIKNDDADTAKFIGWQIARNFLKSVNVPVYDIWLASLCMCSGRKTTTLYSFFCSTKVTIIIMVPNRINEIIDNFEGIPIKQVAYHCELFEEANAISKESTKLLENYLNIQCHVPGPFAEQLFNNHRRLTLVCPSNIKSKNFSTVPMFLTRSCIQLYCYVKGAIPIGENHFPGELQGIPTDVIEGFSRFCSNKLRIGDSVTNTKVKGTLGGFCRFYGREAFLTCAHTMMDWGTLLSTGHKHHTQLESVRFNTGDNILNETPLCGKVVNHTFTHHNPRTISTDAAVIELEKDISVRLDDYVNTKGNGSLHYTELGLKSPFLQDGYIQSPKELIGKNVKVVCARAVSGFKDQGSLISEVSEREMQKAESTNIVDMAMNYIQTTHVTTSVHMKSFLDNFYLAASKERPCTFYNQLAVHNIPFEQGDSGACVYITDGKCAKGCLGMAIADFPGGGCIVTPMATVLEKLGLI